MFHPISQENHADKWVLIIITSSWLHHIPRTATPVPCWFLIPDVRAEQMNRFQRTVTRREHTCSVNWWDLYTGMPKHDHGFYCFQALLAGSRIFCTVNEAHSIPVLGFDFQSQSKKFNQWAIVSLNYWKTYWMVCIAFKLLLSIYSMYEIYGLFP